MQRIRAKFTGNKLTGIGLVALTSLHLWAQDVEPAATASAGPPAEPPAASAGDQVLRSYLQIQEQLHMALLAIEKHRQELEAAAKLNNEMVASRLKLIEQTITSQGEREAKIARSSQRLVLIIAAIFGLVGVGAMVLTSWFQLRTMNRISELGSGSGFYRQLDAPTATVSTTPPAILEAIQRIEQRLLEYQQLRAALPEASAADTAEAPVGPNDRISVLSGKGQTLMRLDRPGEALEAFDEALAVDPENAEILVKKGTALERLKRLDEAIACYDRAIAVNHTLTLAYLCKGGVYNQLERFNEALECYEQALRSQQKPLAA